MNKYTPGSWRTQGNVIFGAEIGKYVCKLFSKHLSGIKSGFAEESANACLIASAPEMLEALKQIHKNITANGSVPPLLFGALIMAEKAISKAEGLK